LAVSLIVRTWNLFHGRTVPETRGGLVERMVRLVTEDEPDAVALQELPVWALVRLEAWSGMRAFAVVVRGAAPVPLVRRVTARWPALVRSGLTGQASALLVHRRHGLADVQATLRLNDRAPGSPLGSVSRRELRRWRREPRLAQAVAVRDGSRTLLVANAHLTNVSPALAELELGRLVAWLGELAAGGAAVLAGDLNLSPATTRELVTLAASGWSAPAAGIDHVLASGLLVSRGPCAWPDERRRVGRALLSDHAPVEAEMMWP
jgi:endonuclease/exonuclease/phosphatase family metal-dependent hydrolase